MKNPFLNFLRSLFKTIVSATYSDNVMTVTYSDKSVEKYEGDSTVWHLMPYMYRCSTLKEVKLTDIHAYIEKWGNPYPTSHKQQQ